MIIKQTCWDWSHDLYTSKKFWSNKFLIKIIWTNLTLLFILSIIRWTTGNRPIEADPLRLLHNTSSAQSHWTLHSPIFRWCSAVLLASHIFGQSQNWLATRFGHFELIIRFHLLKGIAAILGDLLGLARRLINDPIKTHTKVLFGLAPKTCKLQRFDYGIEGITFWK